MQIIFDCERMKYPFTGLFEYCHQLGLALLATKVKQDEVCFYTQKKNEIHFPQKSKFLQQKSIHKFLFPRLKKAVDIWHTTYQTSWYMPPKNRNVKIVLTIHDLNFLYERKPEAKKIKYLKKHQQNIDKADHIVAISEFTKNDIIKHLKVTKPITVIYNGCNVATFPNHNNPIYQPNTQFLFALGTVIPKKNFHVLPCLLKNNNFELIIAGKNDADYKAKILAEATKYNVADRVHILEAISNEDKYWYYTNCKAFLFPSLAEGFGIPVIEAMNFGKPVFLSTATSLPEIGGQFAYYFNNFEHHNMQKVFKEGLQHYDLTKPNADIILHAQKFNWQTCALAYWQVYKSII